MGRSKIKEHNYEVVLRQLIEAGAISGKPGTMSNVTVAHDNDCSYLTGGRCDCSPAFLVEEVPPADPA